MTGVSVHSGIVGPTEETKVSRCPGPVDDSVIHPIVSNSLSLSDTVFADMIDHEVPDARPVLQSTFLWAVPRHQGDSLGIETAAVVPLIAYAVVTHSKTEPECPQVHPPPGYSVRCLRAAESQRHLTQTGVLLETALKRHIRSQKEALGMGHIDSEQWTVDNPPPGG